MYLPRSTCSTICRILRCVFFPKTIFSCPDDAYLLRCACLHTRLWCRQSLERNPGHPPSERKFANYTITQTHKIVADTNNKNQTGPFCTTSFLCVDFAHFFNEDFNWPVPCKGKNTAASKARKKVACHLLLLLQIWKLIFCPRPSGLKIITFHPQLYSCSTDSHLCPRPCLTTTLSNQSQYDVRESYFTRFSPIPYDI